MYIYHGFLYTNTYACMLKARFCLACSLIMANFVEKKKGETGMRRRAHDIWRKRRKACDKPYRLESFCYIYIKEYDIYI